MAYRPLPPTTPSGARLTAQPPDDPRPGDDAYRHPASSAASPPAPAGAPRASGRASPRPHGRNGARRRPPVRSGGRLRVPDCGRRATPYASWSRPTRHAGAPRSVGCRGAGGNAGSPAASAGRRPGRAGASGRCGRGSRKRHPSAAFRALSTFRRAWPSSFPGCATPLRSLDFPTKDRMENAPREPGGDRDDGAGTRRFRLYALALGLVCSILVLRQAGPRLPALEEGLLPGAVFAALIAFSWYYSVALFPSSRLSYSLDMAYMLTALAVLRPPLPLAVAFVGGIAGTLLRQTDRATRHRRLLPVLALNTGALVTTVCVCSQVALRLKAGWPVRNLGWEAVVAVASLYAAYGLTNLVVMGGAVAMRGEPLLPYLGHYLRHVAPLEMLSMPLALGMALLYASAGVWGFAPLGGTILVTSALLRRFNRARS